MTEYQSLTKSLSDKTDESSRLLKDLNSLLNSKDKEIKQFHKSIKKDSKSIITWINSPLSTNNLKEDATVTEGAPDSDYDLSITSIKSDS